MMRTLRFLPLTLAVLAGCTQQSTTPAIEDEAFDIPADQIGFFVTSSLTRDGVRRSEVTADTVLTYEQTRRYQMKGVEMTFFDDSGREAGTLTSNEADYDMGGRLFVARDDVVLITPGNDGGERRLETEELFFDIEGDRLWSESDFVLYEDGQTSSGSSFRSDAQFRTWEVTGGRTEGVVGDEEVSF